MTSIVSNILSFLPPFFFFFFFFSSSVSGSPDHLDCISVRSVLLARALFPPSGVQMQMQTQMQGKGKARQGQPRFLLPSFLFFCWLFPCHRVVPVVRRAWDGWLYSLILSPTSPFPGRPFKGVERASQNKSPR